MVEGFKNRKRNFLSAIVGKYKDLFQGEIKLN